MFRMSGRFDHDVAVLGGGSAGYTVARTTAAEGLRCVVIENGDELGGLCILRGCMPTKLLLYAAEVMHLVRHAAAWGVHVENAGFDFTEVMARKRRLIGEFAGERRAQLTDGAFELVRGHAGFLDAHTLEVSGHGSISASHFVIATGSVVAPPPLDELREVGYLTSDDALELTRLPKSLLVLGGGPVAVEFAQFFARFGVRTTIVQRGKHLLSGLDADAAEVIETVFRREGIDVLTDTELTGARRAQGLKTVSFRHHGEPASVSADEILFALGRIPNTASLGLGLADVATDAGRIATDRHMRTSAPHIYAAGDCTGPHEIVHIAVQQAGVAAHNIAHPESSREMDERLRVRVVFTDPQAAFVGLTETQAEAEGLRCLAARHAFGDHGKSLIMEARDGFVKLLADPDTGEILGGSCVGPLGGELIHEIVVAMARRMGVHEFAALPHYHPTLAEIWTYPADELAARIPSPRKLR